MDHLILSLGHNSSAILVRDNKIVAGYETERLSGVKSDSSFPKGAIELLISQCGLSDPDIYVSHWELFGDVNKMAKKHWDSGYLVSRFPKARIFSTNEYFTHHDAHAWSSITFAGDIPCQAKDRTFMIVCDGFGTFGEHLSIYRYIDGIHILIERKYGFGTSLGLLYQYTTSYLGMKMNQDEYKLLAFEAHIDALFEAKAVFEKSLREVIEATSDMYLARLGSYMTEERTDPMLSIGALPTIASNVGDLLANTVKAVQARDLSHTERRIVVAYFVQSVVERTLTGLLSTLNMDNLILSGGVFYNVKVNSAISRMVKGRIAVMPLAGDQGAGLGVYAAMYPELEWPGHLFWGHRRLSAEQFDGTPNLNYFSYGQGDRAFDAINTQLHVNGMVNVVRGAMEFGPRALCHTSTLARPSAEVAAYINHINDRTNEMPFAPVMTAAQANESLIGCDKVHKSLEYMIITRDVHPDRRDALVGASHFDRDRKVYTARPQVASDARILDLLEEHGPLINTSFNFHGRPIVFDAGQILHTHALEQQRVDQDRPIATVVIGE